MWIADLSRLIAAAMTLLIAATAAATPRLRVIDGEPPATATVGSPLVVPLITLLISTVSVGAGLIGRRIASNMREASGLRLRCESAAPMSAAIGPGLVLIGSVALLVLLVDLGLQVWVASVPLGLLLGAELLTRVTGTMVWMLWIAGLTVAVLALLADGIAREVSPVPGVAPGVVTAIAGAIALGVRWVAGSTARSLRVQWDALRGSDGRRRAEWIHDYLLSEVSHTILVLQARPRVDREAVAHLHGVDHRLRMVQLDELMSAGPTRVASILQPHLRWAEAHGLRIDRTPTSEDVSARVDADTGRMLSHVLSVLLSNAVNAGAGAVGLEVSVRVHEVTVALHDDAGGFDLAEVPAGRALEELRTDLGDERIRREPLEGGSVVIVRLPRDLLSGRSNSIRESADRTVG